MKGSCAQRRPTFLPSLLVPLRRTALHIPAPTSAFAFFESMYIGNSMHRNTPRHVHTNTQKHRHRHRHMQTDRCTATGIQQTSETSA